MINLDKQKYNKVPGIYRIYSTIDDRCYIGSSKNLYSRTSSHKSQLEKNKHHNSKLQNFANKYGCDKLEVEVIVLCKEYELCEMEDYFRRAYNSFDEGFDLLESSYRPSGFKWTETQKLKLKETAQYNLSKNLPAILNNLDKARQGFKIAHAEGRIKNTWVGRKHKKSSKDAMRKAKLGKPNGSKGKKRFKASRKVTSVSKDGVRAEYASAKEAAKVTGVGYKTLQQRIKYNRVGRDGSSWFYA